MSFIYVPFSYVMKGCLFISGNHYIFALFFFALIMQIILLPLAIKQQKSQIKMAQIRPKEMAIREKYKGRTDRVTQQKMTMEIQEMYQKNGYSQFSGCLPLLIQLPIILILFTIVREPINYASDLKDKGFDIAAQSKVAVEFYEDVKNGLVKDKFESTEEYNEYVALIESYQVNLGINEVDDDTPDNAVKIKYQGEDYYATGSGPYMDLGLSRLIIDGEDDINLLVEEGKIDKSILDAYKETKFADYKDDLPNYRIGSVNLIEEPSLTGGDPWLLLIPLLVFLSSFINTKVTRRFSATAQQTDANGNPVGGGLFMEVGMPLISAIFAFNFSAAVGCYWIWRTIIGMGQTVIISKIMPIPRVTEEQIAEARKELKLNQKNKKKKVITIEVDEDDDSYDNMIVQRSSKRSSDPTQRTPRRIEMLTADDEDDVTENIPEENSEENSESSSDEN